MTAIALLLLLANAAAGDAILGQWRGTSTCVKIEVNQYCKDETIQYTFTRADGIYKQVAEKLVNGQYAEMGRLDFHYDPTAKAWSADFTGPRAHVVWSYTIDGDEMKGTCTLLPSKTVVRHVLAHRFKS